MIPWIQQALRPKQDRAQQHIAYRITNFKERKIEQDPISHRQRGRESTSKRKIQEGLPGAETPSS
jgi:hypothetical protein